MMKIRRVIIEVEVPREFDAEYVLLSLQAGIDVHHRPPPCQAQIIHQCESLSTQIGGIAEWPLKSAVNVASSW